MKIKDRLLMFGALLSLLGCTSAPKATLSDHFDGRRFHNPNRSVEKGFSTVLRWMVSRKPAPWPKWIQDPAQPAPPAEIQEGARVTFINHSTFLIQTKDYNILTDPHYGTRASPVSWAGPKRVRAPGVRFEDLPRIDVVLVSHNHYDHTDLETLKRLQRVFRPLFLVAQGNKDWFEANGLKPVQEFDWWQETQIETGGSTLRVTFVPAQHFSARGIFDRNRTLWGGFVFENLGLRFFFAGDTGYNDHFKEIRKRLGAPDVALLPIGAYEPRWFMQEGHMNPEDAVMAHLDLEARNSFGIHFGTFADLTDEPIDEPVIRLREELRRRQLSPEEFRALSFGEGADVKPSAK